MPPPPIAPETPATLAVRPIATPTHGQGGTFTVTCSAHIAAAPHTCLEIVLKAAEDPVWNRFCRKCSIDAQPEQSKKADAGTAAARPFQPDRGPEYLKLGTKFTFDVHMKPDAAAEHSSGRATALEVSRLERIDEMMDEGSASGIPDCNIDSGTGSGVRTTATTPPGRRIGWRVAWKTRSGAVLPAWMLRSERVQEFVEVVSVNTAPGRSETAYTCWETFYGVLAPLVRSVVGSQLVNGFGVWMENLKRRAEDLSDREEGAL
ncbi:hypothetical protein QBC46DRAFT_387983 [Diplogelasinospora grovesii]|uniref:Uncharacterized protein n=1 Tax=Diplogelasinospora grovesii TaxID=303347 RepID=A0AAN6N828_9PEZI|nr:hypothetical protein QBC46DRAFT_387983 [Diplogelasinospora grovesii]